MMQRLRAVGATVLLLAVLVGLPLMLALLLGNPAQGWNALAAGDLSDDVVIDVLAVVAWISWAAFAWAVLGEIVNLMRGPHRPRPLAAVPGLQPLAHALVTAALLAIPAASQLGGGGAAPMSYNATVVTLHSAQTAQWMPVRSAFGATSRAALGQDHPHQPTTSDADAASPALPGDQLPSGSSVSRYVIGDDSPKTWWGLARALLGDGQRWREIWHLNEGIEPTYNGHGMESTDTLKVGQTILVPSQNLLTDPPTNLAPPQSQAAHAMAGPAESESSARSAWAMFGAGAGAGLVAGVTLRELGIRKRRQTAFRRPGRAIAYTPPSLIDIERALVGYGTARGEHVDRLDQCLRNLAQQVISSGARLPDVAAARVSDKLLELVLSSSPSGRAPETPPLPWRVDPSNGHWQLFRSEHDLVSPRQRNASSHTEFAPFPALASIGHTSDGDTWLLDLEHIGALTLLGNRDHGLDLARSLAAELANSTWSDELAVTLVGFGDEITPLNPDRITHTTDSLKALIHATRHVRTNRESLDNLGLDDTLHGRTLHVGTESWVPQILMIDPSSSPTSAPALRELIQTVQSRPGRTGFAVVVARDGEAATARRNSSAPGRLAETVGQELLIRDDGRVHVPMLGQTLTAQQLPPAQGRQLAELLTLRANTTDAPMRSARGENTWDALCDAAGAQLPPPEAARQHDNTATLIPSTPEPTAGRAISTSTPSMANLAGVPRPREDELRSLQQDVDPDLDADLSAWHAPKTVRPRLTLLGPVHVRAQGALPAKRPRLPWHTEVVTYLTAHPRGVTAEQVGTDLWPEDPDIATKTKLRQTLYLVRRWLGINPITGDDYLPAATPDATSGARVYRIEQLLSDADLFRRLRLRASLNPHGGVHDLETALKLVSGVPLDQRRADGYTWLVETPIDAEITAMITDVAHEVASHHLTNGRPDLAANAARVALTAGNYTDIPLLDLVAACDNLDRPAEADHWVQQILTIHEAEDIVDLPPPTARALYQRKWIH